MLRWNYNWLWVFGRVCFDNQHCK